jgi:hypothetical protein
MVKKRPKVQVNYKSGISIVFECDKFTAKRNLASGLSEVEWANAVPDPLFINIDEIESIWQLS